MNKELSNSKDSMNFKQVGIIYLRIFATMCVVILHTCCTLSENSNIFQINSKQYCFYSILYQMMYWCVPVFFMITGMLFLDENKKVEPKQWGLKYAKRIVLALCVFGIPYAFLKKVTLCGVSFELIINCIISVLTNDGFSHLWYLYTLIGIYVSMPVLKIFSSNASKAEFNWVLICMFILDFCFPLLSYIININIAFKSIFIYPFFYVLLGHWLNVNKERFDNKVLLLISILCIIVIIFLNKINWMSKAFTQYNSPLIVLLASTVFLLFIKKDWKVKQIIWHIDRLCFGVYLIHPLFIQFMYRFIKLTPVNFIHYKLITVLFSLGFIIISFIASYLMSQIKILKKYIL